MSATTTSVPTAMLLSGSRGMANHSSPLALTRPGRCSPWISRVTRAVSPTIPWTPLSTPLLYAAPGQPGRSGSERIFDDGKGRVEDGRHVETDPVAAARVHPEILRGQSAQTELLGGGDRFGRCPQPIGSPGLDLAEHDHVTAGADEVDLTRFAAPIPLEDHVPAGDVPGHRPILSELAEGDVSIQVLVGHARERSAPTRPCAPAPAASPRPASLAPLQLLLRQALDVHVAEGDDVDRGNEAGRAVHVPYPCIA